MFLRSCHYCTVNSPFDGASGGIHPFDEMLYIREGEATLEWSGQEYRAEPSSLFLLNRDTPHWLAFRSGPLRFWYIEMDSGDEDGFVTGEQAIRWNRSQPLARLDSTASGESLPMEPVASSPFSAMGCSTNLMSSCVQPKACWRSSKDAVLAKASCSRGAGSESSLMRRRSIH